MAAELTAADKEIVAALLRETIAADRFPLSPRIRRLQVILDKLDPRPAVETLPAPKPPGEPRLALRTRRR